MWSVLWFLACGGSAVDVTDAAAAVCPEGEARLNPTTAPLVAADLIAALPAAGGRWRRYAAIDGAGLVTATYSLDGQRSDGPPGIVPIARVVIEDRVHRCTAAPGTGAAMLAQLAALPDHGAMAIGTRPGVVARAAGTVQLDLWVADRCAVSIGASAGLDEGLDVSGADLQAIAAEIDWAALDRLCAAR
jgi:hypothetical protein